MLMTYDEIRHCLKNSNGADVSRTTKLTPKTLSCLRRGHVKTPSYETLVKLTEYFNANPVTGKEDPLPKDGTDCCVPTFKAGA